MEQVSSQKWSVLFCMCDLSLLHHVLNWNVYYVDICSFYRAMRCISAVFAVTRCLSVCPSVCLSVTFVDHIRTNKHIFEILSPSGSDTILVFSSQRGCRYCDENPPIRGRRMQGGMIKWRFFSQISRCISETVIVRWAHATTQFVSIEFSFHPYNI